MNRTTADVFRGAFASIEVDGRFTEADVTFTDGSRLRFRHTVQERAAEAIGFGGAAGTGLMAGRFLAEVSMFRLNGKHLDVQFADGSRWEAGF